MKTILAIVGAPFLGGCVGLELRVETPDGPARASVGSGFPDKPTPATFDVSQDDFYGKSFPVVVTRDSHRGECAATAIGGGIMSARLSDAVSQDASVWDAEVDDTGSTLKCWLPRERRFFVKYLSLNPNLLWASSSQGSEVVLHRLDVPSRPWVQLIVSSPFGDLRVEDHDLRIDLSIPVEATIDITQGWRPIEGWRPGVLVEWQGAGLGSPTVAGLGSNPSPIGDRSLRFDLAEGATAILHFETRAGEASIEVSRARGSADPRVRIRLSM